MFNYRTERERRQISQAANDDDDAEKEADKQCAVGRQSAGRARYDTLSGERSGDAQNRDDDEEAAYEHGKRKREVVKYRIGIQAGERTAVRRRGRCVGVENFRIAVRSRVADARDAGLYDAGDRGQTKGCGGDGSQGQDRHLDYRGTDLLADVIRRAADHETG